MAVRLLTRRNLFIAICLIIAFSIAMFAPLRHEYANSIDNRSGATTLQTTVRYGTPFTWLILGKEQDVNNPDNVISSSKQQFNKQLVFDVLIWAFIFALGVVVSRYTDTSRQIISDMSRRKL